MAPQLFPSSRAYLNALEVFFFRLSGHYFLISWFTDFLAAKTVRSVGKKKKKKKFKRPYYVKL